ncbi:MAG: hypothetical protein V1754_10130 [Pseudomonadota bacterium]
MKLKRILLLTGVLALIGCGSPQEGVENEKSVNPVDRMTALQQMEISFEGGYTAQQIKPLMDKALQVYGLPINEENYSRAASTLIILRQEFGTKEMDILDYMIRSYVPGETIQFPEAAGIASAFLAAGDPMIHRQKK